MSHFYTPSPGHVWKLESPFAYLDSNPDGKIAFYAGTRLGFKVTSEHPIILFSHTSNPVECFKLRPVVPHSLIELEVKKVYNEFGITTKLLWVASRLHGTWEYEGSW